MNQEQNNFNENNFNAQNSNGTPNNQQPINQMNMQQPMNSFENGSGKPPKKMNFGLIIGIIAVVAVIGIGVVFGSKLLSNNKNSNNSTENNVSENNNNENTINNNENNEIGTSTWGLTFNGKSVDFPCLLKDLTNIGISLTSNEYYDKVINNANSEFAVIFAGNESWDDEISLSLKTKEDISKKEENVVVTNIIIDTPNTESKTLTKEQFHLKENISLGSTKDGVISVFGNEYVNEKEVNEFSKIAYENEESELHLSFTNNILRTIQIWKK